MYIGPQLDPGEAIGCLMILLVFAGGLAFVIALIMNILELIF